MGVTFAWQGCLNPCFNGIWSRTEIFRKGHTIEVLILVLMEYGLGPGVQRLLKGDKIRLS